MKVLSIIGIVAFIALILWLIFKLNIYTYQKYKKEFFNYGYFLAFSTMYGLSYYGFAWYMDAIKSNEDILNGIIIMAIAIVIFVLIIYVNIKTTNFWFGISITFIQFVIYIPLAVAGAIVLLAAMVFFSQTKPVYNINNK